VAQVGLIDHDASEEGAEREGDAEQRRGAHGDSQGDGEDREREELAGTGPGDVLEQPGHHPPADEHHDDDEERDLAQRDREHADDACRSRACWQQHQREDHDEVLHNQPPDGDASFQRACRATLLQRAEEHDRARHREREPEDQPRAPRPAPQAPGDGAEQRGHGNLSHGARQGDPADREQLAQREVDAHAEHQQDHANLGQLGCELRIRHEPRCEGAQRHAGEQVADQRGEAQADRGKAQQQCHGESRSDGGEQRSFV
jgi:hypothetical protein